MSDDPVALLAESGSVLADLSEAERRALGEVCEVRSFTAGETLFLQDAPADGFFVVIAGKVKVYRLSPDGREQILHLFGPGELVGEVPVFQGGRYPASASAATRLTAVFVPRDGFRELGQANPQLLLDLLAILSGRLRRFVHLIDDLALKEVGSRLARHLLDLRPSTSVREVVLDGSKLELASRIGTIAETLSRTLKKLQDADLIAVEGRRIRLLDVAGLEDLAAGMKR